MKPLRKEALDQLAHFALGGLPVVILSLLGPDQPPLNGALIGLWIGATREVTEGGRFGMGSARDILFWTFGGAFGGWVL